MKTVETAPPPAATETRTAVAASGRPKPKQRMSRGLKPVLKLERGVAKASARLGKAVSKGTSNYFVRRDLSAEERRDGALREGPKNVARSLGKVVKGASRVPLDLVEAVNTKRATKQVRMVLRNFMRPFSG